MTSYTDAFSNGLKPPSEQGLAFFTIEGTVQTQWPAVDSDAAYPLATIVELTCALDSILRLPAANAVSNGASCLLINKGLNTLGVQNYAGDSLTSVVPGAAIMFYVASNSTLAGSWGQLAYGAVPSALSAGAIAGYGTKATGSTLSVASQAVATAEPAYTLQLAQRGATVEFTGGAATLSLLEASYYGADFYCFVKNSGEGTVTISPAAGSLIDKVAELSVQPNESLILIVVSDTSFVTVGQGKSTVYQFSNLTLDVSAGGSFTLSASQASNKMLTFVGNPGAEATVVVPNTVSVYYAANNLSTAQSIVVKTVGMPGASVGQSQRAVLLCDGSLVTSAQTTPANSVQSLLDGTAAAPSLNFASKTNTGIFKFSTQGIAASVNGVAQWQSNGGGVIFPLGLSTTGGNVSFTGTLTHSGDVFLSGTGKRITGDFSNAVVANRVMFQTSTANSATGVYALPHGTGVGGQFGMYGHSDTLNATFASVQALETEMRLNATKTGTKAYPTMTFYTGGAERMRIGVDGQLGIAGANYGTAGQVIVSGGPSVAPAWGTVSGVPTGAVIHTAASTAPTGFLKANGALVSRTTYAALFAVIGTTFGAGDGSTTFALPDLRGEFLRGLDDGRGVDAARVLGSSQLDAFQGHRHATLTSLRTSSGGSQGGSSLSDGTTSAAVGDPTVSGSLGTPRTGSETRPRNVALLACIKF